MKLFSESCFFALQFDFNDFQMTKSLQGKHQADYLKSQRFPCSPKAEKFQSRNLQVSCREWKSMRLFPSI
jgi:hypothetical protein